LRGRGTGDDADEDGDAGEHPATDRLQDMAVALELLLLLGDRTKGRPQLVGDHHVGGHDNRHDRAEHEEQQHFGGESPAEDRRILNRTEPQQVGVLPDKHRGDDQEDDERDDNRDDGLGAATQLGNRRHLRSWHVERHNNEPTGAKSMRSPIASSAGMTYRRS
jgi:hypothetical protein